MIENEKVILTGCKNNNFYAFNYSTGELRFVIATGDDVYNSPSFDQDGNIYFGSDDGNVYAVDIDGNALSGFPLYLKIQFQVLLFSLI